MRIANTIATIVIGLMLAGCVVSGHADLGEAAERTTPLKTGGYKLTQSKNAPVELSIVEGDVYRMVAKDKPGEHQDYSIFGPVGGYFVAQSMMGEPTTGMGPYGYFIIRVATDGSVFSIDAPIEALGEMLFAELGVPEPADVDVSVLGDNAALNWATVQKLIITRSASFTEELYMTPAR